MSFDATGYHQLRTSGAGGLELGGSGLGRNADWAWTGVIGEGDSKVTKVEGDWIFGLWVYFLVFGFKNFLDISLNFFFRRDKINLALIPYKQKTGYILLID